jgi:hypothetical protein
MDDESAERSSFPEGRCFASNLVFARRASTVLAEALSDVQLSLGKTNDGLLLSAGSLAGSVAARALASLSASTTVGKALTRRAPSAIPTAAMCRSDRLFMG